MKKISIIIIIVSAIFLAGIITAGCTQQDTGSSVPPATGDQSPSGGGNAPPAGDSGVSGSGNANGNANGYGYGHGSGGNYQSRGQGFMTNDTMLTAAAGKLGVSEQDLKNALNSTANATSGRPNLSAAAQQLGITQQQLMDAMGFPAGGFRGRNTTAMATTPNP
ncbi:MAG TPA: hypothetical protein VLY83_02860 [Methanoregula sp.]|nr:hypothetical protein [Methanoregula sp.]